MHDTRIHPHTVGGGEVPERGWDGGGGPSLIPVMWRKGRMLEVGGGGGIARYRDTGFKPTTSIPQVFGFQTTEKDLCGNNLTKRTLSAPERQICTDIVIITSIKFLAVCETTC